MLRRSFLTVLPILPAAAAPSRFLVEPYINLGEAPGGLSVVFHTDLTASAFTVRGVRTEVMTIANPPHLVHEAKLPLEPPFEFEIQENGQTVYRARVKTRRAPRHRFVVLGDPGQSTNGQRALAELAKSLDPDFVFFGGDMVYEYGRVSDYRRKFFPVYRELFRERLIVGAPGNHDTDESDFSAHPDAYAFFPYWRQPGNGPLLDTHPSLKGNPSVRDAFLQSVGGRFPRALNFSFDFGNTHWTIVDSNKYANLRDPKLQDWLAKDLAAARQMDWRFVGIHHPPFHSARKHADEQQSRWLAGLFQEHNVDVVFSGHTHNYQRSHPLRFLNPRQDKGQLVKGNILPDPQGRNGVVYIVSGAGGAGLHSNFFPAPFTARTEGRVHSLSVVDIDGRTLKFRQIGAGGREIDAFTL